MDYRTIVVDPQAAHTHTVVFLHGRGDHLENFIRALDYSTDSQNRTLMHNFPSFKWVFPEAPLRQSIAPMGSKCHQWFDIWNTRNFTQREELQAEGLKESVHVIRGILQHEADILDHRWDKLILAGISQGAATAVHTLYNLNIPFPAQQDGQSLSAQPNSFSRLGAFLGFSCRLPFPDRSLADTRVILGLENVPDHDQTIRNTPILLEHCRNDQVVLLEGGRALRDSLRGFGANVTWREYPDGGHWFNSPQGIDDVVQFLKHTLDQTQESTHPNGMGTDNPSAMDLS